MSTFQNDDHAPTVSALVGAGEHAVYVLRVWYERDGEAAVWRASVKPPNEEARRHFTRPEALLAYLSGRLGVVPTDTS